ncbi:Serine-enriched protein [Habropoda laboriosa]|uniref:Serine-enriched protein n=1 Tax=Habropoda laboriosa TaxID=597456 RepID=A0A0L7R7G7_9HYME|nr:Serine-enriched protein [Habropoda laboriosa]
MISQENTSSMPEASGSEVAEEPDYSIFENKTGLAEDMKFLASMPELCDVTFLVGSTKEPICAVKAVLAARSRVFQKLFYQAPSPQRKKEPPPRENKIRLFLKRSSEPLLNLQNATQQRSGFAQQLAPIQEPNQHHTVTIEEFEPDVFRQLIEYIHTGSVTLQPRTLLGLMNAADFYGLEQLRKACTGFVQCCITVDTVCALLASAERYIQYKCTKSLVQKVLEFVDEHGNEVLNLGSFTLLPEHVVRLILAREELRADEFTKFQAALMWSKKYCDGNQNQDLKNVIGNFLEYIQFHKIPANVLMREVNPLGLVPSETIMTALAYQADPNSVDPEKLSPPKVKHQDRSLSVQSSLQDLPYGSNTSLCLTASDEGSDDKQHSGKNSIAEQETGEQQQHQQWQQPKQQGEEEDLQRLIEQRSQFQQMRQEEELKEDAKDLQRKETLKRKEQKEDSKEQQQRDKPKKKKQKKSPKEQHQEEKMIIEQKDPQQQIGKEELLQQQVTKEQLQKEEEKEAAVKDEEKLQQQLEQEKQFQEEQKWLKQQEEEEQRRIREEKKLQLQLEELKTQWSQQQELMFQREEVDVSLQHEIQKRRYEEQLENQQFQQLQLQLEGRKPQVENRLEQRQVTERRKSKKRKEERVEIRVHEAEPQTAPAEGVTGLYIKLVVRQEGRANLVWLLKTHKF